MKSRPMIAPPIALLCLVVMAVAALAGVASAASVTAAVGNVQAKPGSEIVVPVILKNASGIGAMHLELVYDASALDGKAIASGSLIAENCMVETNTQAPGRVIVGFVSQDPIDGDGELLKARFTVKADAPAGQSKLDLQNVRAWGVPKKDREHAHHLIDVLAKVETGELTVARGVGVALIGLIALAVFAVVLVLYLIVRSIRRAR